jgi:hypothetical protein
MVAADAVPWSLLADGLAQVGADGVLAPKTATMRQCLGARSAPGQGITTLDQLAAMVGDADALHAGELVRWFAAGVHWELQLHPLAGQRWLVARDVSAAARAEAERCAAARLRSLGAAAGTFVHDLGNHLNLTLAMLAEMGDFARSPDDAKWIGELAHGASQGAHLARVLARLLTLGSGEPVRVEADALLRDGAMAATKMAALAEVPLRVEPAAPAAWLRVEPGAATHALLQFLAGLIERRPRQLEVATHVVEHCLAGGRRRRCWRVRLFAAAPWRQPADDLVTLLNLAHGTTSALTPQLAHAHGLVVAALSWRRLGGDLTAVGTDRGLQIDCHLPLAVGGSG